MLLTFPGTLCLVLDVLFLETFFLRWYECQESSGKGKIREHWVS